MLARARQTNLQTYNKTGPTSPHPPPHITTTESPARSTFQIYANKVLTKLPGYNVINPVAGYKSPNIAIELDTLEIRVCSARGLCV